MLVDIRRLLEASFIGSVGFLVNRVAPILETQQALETQDEFEKLIVAMGIDENGPRKKGTEKVAAKGKIVDPKQTASVKDFFRVLPSNSKLKEQPESVAKKEE